MSSPEIVETERKFGSLDADFRVYQRLAELMAQGKHGQRWDIRSFSADPEEAKRLDPYGVLRLDKPFLPILNGGEGIAPALALFSPCLVVPGDLDKLVAALGPILLEGPVRDHRAQGGTVVFSLAPHKSYADIPIWGMATAMLGTEIASHQVEFTHRQVALQQFAGFKIIDDGILRSANILQTFPDSKSGKDDAFVEVRDHANMLAVKEFTRLVRRGGYIFWINEGGSESRLDPVTGYQVAARASKGSAGLLHHHNRRGANRILTIPCAMDCDPFKPGGGFAPHEIPFRFLEPRFLQSDEEVHAMMEETLEVHNEIKRPETPLARYETAEEQAERLGS